MLQSSISDVFLAAQARSSNTSGDGLFFSLINNLHLAFHAIAVPLGARFFYVAGTQVPPPHLSLSLTLSLY